MCLERFCCREMTTAHLILGGRERPRCFRCAEDRLAFLERIVTFAAHCECTVHAYALMANHAHLLMTCFDVHTARQFTHMLLRSYAHHVLRRHGTGEASGDDTEIRLIHARRYLLGCMRYIELNPVRAHMVEQPGQYRWSSYRANALGYVDPVVTPHPLYFALGRSAEERRRAYARFVERNHFGAATSP